MTDKTFARGLNLYLKEKHMSSATPQDFYRIMQQAFNEDHPEKEVNISAFMDTWVNQPGYPMITVRREDDTLYISQQRYHQNTPEEVDPVWSIPLSYVTASNPDSSNTTPDLWIHDAHVDINRSEAEKAWTATDWVLFNVQETGYYRVNYDIELWKLLSEELYKGDHTKIHVVNRAQLIDDSFNLAKSEHIPYTILLDFLNYLTHESDYLPWAAADKALSFLNSYLIGSQYYDHFQSMIRYASNSFYERLGAEPVSDEPPLDVLGRNVAINWACLMKHPKCIADTTSLMESLAIGGDSIVPDLESTIYCNGMRVASASTFGTMWSSALYSDNTYLKALILNSLGCSHSSVQLKAYMESSMNPAFIYDELDRVQVISAVYSNGGLLGLNLALDFLVTTNIDELEQ